MNQIDLTGDESAIISWTIALIADDPARTPDEKTDPLFILLRDHKRTDIIRACQNIESDFKFDDNKIRLPLTKISADILRLCVENSDYLYFMSKVTGIEHKPPVALFRKAHAAMISLSYKLDAVGVEVNFIPPIE